MKVSTPAPPPAPAPVNPGQASIDFVNAMADPALQARLLAAEQQFRPQYAALNLADLNSYLLGTGGQQGALALQDIAARQSAATEAGARGISREADIADVERLGPRAAEAFRAANPELQTALARAAGLSGAGAPLFREFEQAAIAQQNAPLMAMQRPQDIARGQLGESIYSEALAAQGLGRAGTLLGQRAEELAQSRGRMTADEIRTAQQQVREAYAARGVEGGSGAVSAEALSRLSGERERMERDLALAASLNAATQAELGQNRAFRMGASEADMARLSGNRAAGMQADLSNLQAGLSQQQMRMGNLGLLGQMRQGQLGQDRSYALSMIGAQQGAVSDPFQAILGRPSQAMGAGQFQQQFAGGLASGMQGPQLFDPNAGINLALQNQSNQANYQASTYGAQQASRGAILGGMFQGIGSALSCHVAREVFGPTNPQWLRFFVWKELEAPMWFRKLYNKHSEAIAAFIRNKPVLKALIRRWMERQISTIF